MVRYIFSDWDYALAFAVASDFMLSYFFGLLVCQPELRFLFQNHVNKIDYGQSCGGFVFCLSFVCCSACFLCFLFIVCLLFCRFCCLFSDSSEETDGWGGQGVLMVGQLVGQS